MMMSGVFHSRKESLKVTTNEGFLEFISSQIPKPNKIFSARVEDNNHHH